MPQGLGPTVTRINRGFAAHLLTESTSSNPPKLYCNSYAVDGDGIYKTNDRINAFKKIKMLETLADLETYFGMAGWLCRGISWFDVKAAPL